MLKPAFVSQMSEAMADVYGAVTDKILINLAKYFPFLKSGVELPGSFDYQARMLAQMGQINKETIDIIMSGLEGADQALRQALEASIIYALEAEEPKLRKAAEKGILQPPSIPEVVPGQMQAFKAYYRQSADKLNLVNTVMLESTQAAYTATVSDIANKIARTQTILNVGAGEVVTGVTAYNQAVRESVRKMVSNGITGFVDHGGHHWTPEAYAAMDIRTTMNNVARAATWERNEGYGNDLYQVSWHNGARPLCYPWQGKVISRSDMVREVEDLDGNSVHVYAQSETSYGEAAGLFGVNCSHYPMVFVPGISTLYDVPQDEEENAKDYEESQQQRALERKLRYEKRDLEVLKAQGASEDVLKAQQAKVKKASRDIDDFCEETGRTRRRDREGTPINAKFPPKESYNPAEFPTTERDKMREFFRGNDQQSEKAYSTLDINKPKRERINPNDPDYYEKKDAYRKARDEYNREIDKAVEEGVKIKRFETVDDVVKWAKDRDIEIEKGVLEKIDIRAFNESSMALDEMFDRFPEVKSYAVQDFDGTMFTPKFRIGLNDVGLLSADGGFNFNPSEFDDYAKGLKQALQSQTDGFLVRGDGTFSTLVRHEYGHNVDSYIRNKITLKHKQGLDDWRKAFSTFDEYKRAKELYSEEMARYRKELYSLSGVSGSSEYSRTNEDELFAEGFAEWASGGNSTFGKAFGEFLKRWY